MYLSTNDFMRFGHETVREWKSERLIVIVHNI